MTALELLLKGEPLDDVLVQSAELLQFLPDQVVDSFDALPVEAKVVACLSAIHERDLDDLSKEIAWHSV